MGHPILVYGMLLHPDTSCVLLVPSAGGWTFPHFHRERWLLWSSVADVNEAMRRQLGIAPVTLRCHAIDARGAGAWLMYGVENTDPAWAPPQGSRWASCGEVMATPLLDSRLTELVTGWFAWEGLTDRRRVPWYQRGWSVPVTEWATQQMANLGLRQIGPVQQLRTWQRSTVWSIPTADGPVYLKAVPPFLSHEIPLTEYLATLFPNAIPQVLASEHSQGWMLMASAGDRTLTETASLDAWSTALHRYAEMQVELRHHLYQLAALGCPVLPPAQLVDMLAEVVTSLNAFTPDDAQLRFSAEEIELLVGRRHRISEFCERLSSSPMLLSLDHGDLWSAQIMLQAGEPVFTDWSDANVTMPFLSPFKYLMGGEADKTFPGCPAAERTLRSAYLAPWTRFASCDQLEELWESARAVAALHYAALSHRHLMPWMEVRWENENMVPFFLKRLVDSAWPSDAIDAERLSQGSYPAQEEGIAES